MKKMIALLMAMAMLLAGCGGEESVSGKVEPAPETTAAAPEVTEPVSEETEVAPAEETAPETPVSMGRIEGGTYTNAYVGIACELDENWAFYGAEELQEMPAAVKEAMAGAEIEEALENVEQFTDMMAENAEQMMSVNLLYQKHTVQERVAFSLLSEEQIVDETLSMQDMMVEAYAQAGMEVESMEKVKITFLGEERFALRTVANVQGVTCYMLQILDYHLGAYSATLTATSYLEDNTQAILDLFYPV